MSVESPGGRQWPAEGRHEVSLSVNGESRMVRAGVQDTLLGVLRRELKLFGAREGCGVGMCGACTVLVDGRPISSCLMPALLVGGGEITTVEGLEASDGSLDPVQQAYIESTAFQCSFCTPGFVLATKALLEEQPSVTEGEARRYLAGNLCRCGSYVKIMDAVTLAQRRRAGDPGDGDAQR